MAKLGMHSLLGVGQGSSSESKLVIMEWKGSTNKEEAPIALVGKGVVFDTGGISLKPANKMDAMKGDMVISCSSWYLKNSSFKKSQS